MTVWEISLIHFEANSCHKDGIFAVIRNRQRPSISVGQNKFGVAYYNWRANMSRNDRTVYQVPVQTDGPRVVVRRMHAPLAVTCNLFFPGVPMPLYRSNLK